jgi:hypothetical protein
VPSASRVSLSGRFPHFKTIQCNEKVYGMISHQRLELTSLPT